MVSTTQLHIVYAVYNQYVVVLLRPELCAARGRIVDAEIKIIGSIQRSPGIIRELSLEIQEPRDPKGPARCKQHTSKANCKPYQSFPIHDFPPS